MLCEYGCKNESKFVLKNGKNCCSKHWNSCPVSKQKNAAGLEQAYAEGRKGYTYNSASCWNKGNVSADFVYNGKGSHKQVLIKERSHTCESCLLSDWLGKPITLELEHVDGDSKNNVKSNLKLLCPNCHSQTPTWRRRKTNGTGTNYSDPEMIAAIESCENMNQVLNKLNLKWGSNRTIKRVIEQYGVSFKPKEPKEPENTNVPKPRKASVLKCNCLQCGAECASRAKYCSYACMHKASRKVDWDSLDLPKLLETKSVRALAKELGVSDSAITKRLKKLGL